MIAYSESGQSLLKCVLSLSYVTRIRFELSFDRVSSRLTIIHVIIKLRHGNIG